MATTVTARTPGQPDETVTIHNDYLLILDGTCELLSTESNHDGTMTLIIKHDGAKV